MDPSRRTTTNDRKNKNKRLLPRRLSFGGGHGVENSNDGNEVGDHARQGLNLSLSQLFLTNSLPHLPPSSVSSFHHSPFHHPAGEGEDKKVEKNGEEQEETTQTAQTAQEQKWMTTFNEDGNEDDGDKTRTPTKLVAARSGPPPAPSKKKRNSKRFGSSS